MDVTSLAISGNKVVSLNSDNVTLQFNTPATGGSATPSYFMTAKGGDGTGETGDVVVTINGTVVVPATLQTTAITTGSSSTVGTVVGNWEVQSSSNWDVTRGTLYSTTLNAGPSGSSSTTQAGTNASITGTWTLVTGSSIVIPSGTTLNATNGQIDAQSITTGGATTAGTLTGAWTINSKLILYSSGTIDATAGTLKSTTLNAGSSTTAGTLTGNWSATSDGHSTIAATTANLATTATTANNLSGTTANTVPYQSGSGTTSYSTVATDGTFLKYTTASGFTWGTPSVSTVVAGGTVTTTSVTTSQIIANGPGSPATGTISGVWSLTGTGSSLQATYSDLAEWYTADAEYEPGTVLVFGGDAETTTTTTINDTRCAGVVTTDPAYIMNSELTGTKACLALAGRVPCKVVGRVKKGDILTTSATPGYAVRATTPTLGAIVGKALEDKDYGEAGVIEIAVGRA